MSPPSTDRGLSRADRLRAGLATLWAIVVGAAPHVLHHVGPLAGAAILAGASGRILFAALGLVLTIPTLRRLHRHTGGWAAPAAALALMTAAFAISTWIIGPALTSDPAPKATPDSMPNHESHHQGN